MATTTKVKNNGRATIRPIDRHILGGSNFQEIPVDKLIVDPAYQRDINEKAIQRIINTFDPNLLEPPTVNARGGKFYLIDGQHRHKVAKSIGMPTLTCRVIEVDRETEAKLFVELNRQRIMLNPIGAFKAELLAKNPAAIEIKNCVESRGLAIGLGRVETEIAALAALKAIYKVGGFIALARALDVIVMSWPADEKNRFSGQILAGVDEFLRANPRADLAKLAEKLADVTPRTLLAKASQRWHSHRGLGHTDKSVTNCVAEEVEKTYRRYTRQAV